MLTTRRGGALQVLSLSTLFALFILTAKMNNHSYIRFEACSAEALGRAMTITSRAQRMCIRNSLLSLMRGECDSTLCSGGCILASEFLSFDLVRFYALHVYPWSTTIFK